MSRSRVCHKCTKRTLTCHSTCKDYADEVAEREKAKEVARKDRIMPVKRLKNVRKYQSPFKNFL